MNRPEQQSGGQVPRPFAINPGDTVTVNMHGIGMTLVHDGIVRWIPCATGDSWIIEAPDGSVHYISEGCTVTKRAQVSP